MFPDLDEFEAGASFTIKERALDRKQYNVDQALPPEAIRFNVDEMYHPMRARLSAYIYTESIGEYEHRTAFPLTWWDHFKRDHFPKWLLDRFPVRYNIEYTTLTAEAMYPEFRPPNGYSQVRYIIRETDGSRVREDAWGA